MPYTVNKRYYSTFYEIYREPIEDDEGYSAGRCGLYTTLDDAVKGESYSLYSNMWRYFPKNQSLKYDAYVDTSNDQDEEMFINKVSDYTLKVRVISNHPLVFESQRELAEYYAEAVSNGNLTQENIYDFLLSLVRYEERYYDRRGTFLYSRIVRQGLDGTTDYDIIPDFSMETACEVCKQQEKWKERLYADE